MVRIGRNLGLWCLLNQPIHKKVVGGWAEMNFGRATGRKSILAERRGENGFCRSNRAKIPFRRATGRKWILAERLGGNEFSWSNLAKIDFGRLVGLPSHCAKIHFRAVALPKFISAQPLRQNPFSASCCSKINFRTVALPKLIFVRLLHQN